MNQLARIVLGGAAVGVGAWLLSRPLRDGNRYGYRGKVALVTGGSRGLGLVMARQLAERGARVAVCARDRDEVERAGQDLVGHGDMPLALPCDITDPQQVRDLVQAVTAHFGRLDVLINNAGIIQVGPLETMTRADFEQALAVNFWGAYNCVEAALPGMRERGEGRIINITSIGGRISVPHLLPYCVGKFAFVGYSQGLRAALAHQGIVVTTVTPGLMRTGSPPNALFKGKHEAEYAWFAISDSLPLLSMAAEDAAAQILDAGARGDAEVILTLPANIAVRLHSLFPDLFARLLEFANQVLPGSGPEGQRAKLGKDSESARAPSLLTATTDAAARRNNEIAPAAAPAQA